MLGWITGNTAGARNRERVRQENRAFKLAREDWKRYEEERKNKYDFDKDNYAKALEEAEERTRFEETGIIQSYESQVEMRDFEFDAANRAYDKSLSQATKQKTFNQMAADAAIMQQNDKLKDDLLGVLFDESATFLDYKAKSTGLQRNKRNQLVQADFQEAQNIVKNQFDVGSLGIQRNQKRAESQRNTQKAILEGMKAAGQFRSRGTNGRTSAKSVLGVLAESGAIQAGIANGLMYAEQEIDLDIAKLQDMFILDQTMVMAARDKAIFDSEFEQATLDATNQLDIEKIAATRDSIQDRDTFVRREIFNSRMQADLNAEAAILLKPERLPDLADPREVYAEYDNPETEDYVELFFRGEPVEFPEYIPSREPERDDFRGPRENAVLGNVMEGISTVGMIAGGIGSITGASSKFLGITGQTYTNIGNWLGGGSSIFR